MGYIKLKDNADPVVAEEEEIAKKSEKKTLPTFDSLRLRLSSKKRAGYGSIKEASTATVVLENNLQKNNSSVDVFGQNNILRQDKNLSSENNKALEQIQNALFVTRELNNFPTTSCLEIESANFKEQLEEEEKQRTFDTKEESELAKSRPLPSSSASPSSCQRIRCKKLVKRIKKVLGETLKFSSDRSATPEGSGDAEEDIYVEVNQLVTNNPVDIYSYLEKGGNATMQEMRSRFESNISSSSSASSTSSRPVPRPSHLYSNAIHNQNLINNNSSVISSQNFINNNHTGSSSSISGYGGGGGGVGNLSKSVDNCWTGSNNYYHNNSNRFCNGNVVVATPTSEEDNSPTEMNSCRKFIDKPPLVKRLTMALLLKTSEDSRPLMCNSQNSNLNNYKTTSNSSYSKNVSSATSSPSKCTPSYDGYVNEGICDLEQIISSKFGDSCRKSLMSMTNHHDTMNWSIEHLSNQEFNFKKNLLRETSSANSSPKIFSKPFRGAQHLNCAEQQELKDAPWFQAGIPRDISLEVLSKQTPGAFLVRQSNSKPGCYVLSLRVSPPLPKVAHYLILRTSRGYKIKGFTKEFTSLRALITHHSVMPELLPVPLAMPRPKNIPARRNVNDFDTYESLSDFQKLMTDLNDNLKLSTLVL